MIQLVRAPARRAGDPGSNPGQGENFSLKLTNEVPPCGAFSTLHYHRSWVQIFSVFYSVRLLASRQTSKLEDQSWSAINTYFDFLVIKCSLQLKLEILLNDSKTPVTLLYLKALFLKRKVQRLSGLGRI